MSVRMLRAIGATIVLGLAVPGVAVAAGNSGRFVLTATSAKAGYAPTFIGNGLLGIRIPPTGQGYAGGTVPSQAELAGFYGKPVTGTISQKVQQRANIPTWSTLTVSDGGVPFSLTHGRTSGWRQTLDLRTGTVTTTATWTAPSGHVFGLRYVVFTDRARPNVAVSQLSVTPRFTGTATVTDAIDGTADRIANKTQPSLTLPVSATADPVTHSTEVTIAAQQTGITATEATTLGLSPDVVATTTVPVSLAQSVAETLSFPVTAGQTYTLTKYVGIADSNETPNTVAAAQSASASAAGVGVAGLQAEDAAAWAQLWQGRIDVAGNPTLATDVNASEFYLWSSTRADEDWSISPAGLSSNGYDGHIFWDAETWMYPSLLAQHPDLAAAMDAYRFDRLGAAEAHAVATGFTGARFPWESALDGTEQIPPPVSINSEGLYEQHIVADVALAQWQYYLTTGDRFWLATRGWPVISQAATFWAGRAQRAAGGEYVISHVTDPDEENPDISQGAFTVAGARAALLHALAAAHALGYPVPSSWARIAAGLRVPVVDGVHPEFTGYGGQLVKQADVTMLQYPWAYPMSHAVAQADVNYYVPRSDPGGPSMTDAISEIDTAALGTPGCASYVDTERSVQPFLRDVFHQFSETRTGGAFTFMTGIGGFLQEFLYGYSGMRWDPASVALAPSLNAQLGTAVTLRGVQWRGRVFDVTIARRVTTVTLLSGAPLPLSTPRGRLLASEAHPITIPTARPDLDGSSDAVRCTAARASSSALGAPALAAVDGSPATDWQPASLPARLTAPTRAGHRTVRVVTVLWGQAWPPAPKPNVHPPARPVQLVRSRDYVVEVRLAGSGRWRAVAVVRRRSGLRDVIRLRRAVRAGAVRLVLIGGSGARTVKTSSVTKTMPILPMVQELTATG